MNLAQMRVAVRSRVGVPASDSFYTDPQINDFINEGLQAFQNEQSWPWLQGVETITTVAGTESYTPGDPNWQMTKALYISGFDPLILSNLQDVDSVTVQGQPDSYVVFQDKIVLSPTPSGVYAVTHQYYKGEPTLSNDTDTPISPAEFHYALIAYAVHLCHLRSGEVSYYRGAITGKAAAALQEYTQWVGRARDLRRRSSAPLSPRVRGGGWY